MFKAGFIGGGNMALAIIGGIIKSGVLLPEDIIVSDRTPEMLTAIEKKYGVNTTLDNREVAQRSQLIFLTIKPQFYQNVIEQIKDTFLAESEKIVITVAPGWTLARTGSAFGGSCKIVRTMPNTPAFVGEGITAACKNDLVATAEMEQVCQLLGSFGRVEILPEGLFDAFTALCGSSPAFVFMMIEAMADAAVREGILRSQAYILASQAVLGSAKMVLELGRHPAELKDMVCSPGGSTIEGVRALEESGMRAAFFKAVEQTAAKSKNM